MTPGSSLIVVIAGFAGWENKLELPHETCWSVTDHSPSTNCDPHVSRRKICIPSALNRLCHPQERKGRAANSTKQTRRGVPLGNGRRTFHKRCGSLYASPTVDALLRFLHEAELMIALPEPVSSRLPVLSEGWIGFLASKWKERGGCC